jgi:acyl phosphate:glycerol-3-phosphate acyltransferase
MIFVWVIIPILFAYLIGSIPFGLIITKFFGYGDIRNIGSGNIGATNVMRTGNKKLAILTLLLDFLKGFLPVLLLLTIASSIMFSLHSNYESYIDSKFCYINHSRVFPAELLLGFTSGIAIIIGHIFPIWLKFKGGKGVATAIGVITAINPFLALCLIIIWLTMFMMTRISSLSALTAFLGATIFCFTPLYAVTAKYCGTQNLYIYMMLVITIIIFFTHRSNIKKLINGTEHKWGSKK